MYNIFEKIQRVSQQSGVPYLKETQQERKAETCAVNRDANSSDFGGASPILTPEIRSPI